MWRAGESQAFPSPPREAISLADRCVHAHGAGRALSWGLGRWLGRTSPCSKQFLHPHRPLNPSFWAVSGFEVSAAPAHFPVAVPTGLGKELKFMNRRPETTCRWHSSDTGSEGRQAQVPQGTSDQPGGATTGPAPQKAGAPSQQHRTRLRCRCPKVAEVSVQPQVPALQAVGSAPLASLGLPFRASFGSKLHTSVSDRRLRVTLWAGSKP